MNIIPKIKELNFPPKQYVVVGSGILDVLGIRKSSDVDIAVNKDLYQKLRETSEWEEYEKYGKIFLKKEGFDIIPQLDWKDYKTTTEEAISSALIVESINFMNLEELIKFKTALGREKDLKDIELINKYQEEKTNKRVRAIIIEDGKVLLMHRNKHGQEYWVFPGGGLEDMDDNIESGLKRECLEELGVNIEVKDLCMKIVFLPSDSVGHIQYFYNCKIVSGEVGTGTGPEFTNRDINKYGTYEVVWIPIAELKDKNVYPFEVRDKVIKMNL